MIKQATVTIKNITNWTGDIGRVTLFTGENRAGKTAIQEAIRLALTDTCSIGASIAKQKLLASGNAAGVVVGEEVSGSWTLVNGRRTHHLLVGEMEVKSVTGDMPLTIEEYWALTGEQRWAMVESIVGPFTKQAPDRKDASREKLKALRSQVAPPAYDGRSIPELQNLSTHLKGILNNAVQASLVQADKQNKSEELEQSIKHTSELLAILQKEQARLELAIKDDLAGQVLQMVIAWQTSPGNVLSGCGTLKDALGKLYNVMQEKGSAICQAMEQTGASAYISDIECLITEAREIYRRSADQLETYLIDSGSQFAAEITSKLADYGMQANVASLEDAVREYRRLLDGGKLPASLNRCNEMIAKAEAGLKEYRCKLAEVEATVVPSIEGAEQAAKELDEVKADITKAIAYRDWLDGAEQRAEQIKLLEAEVSSADIAIADYAKRRASYLSSAATLVSDKANELLGEMGFPRVSISIDTSGKRGTLTAVAEGVDIQAMAGSEKLLYGVALVNAFHELSKVKLPVLFVEAAELNSTNLEKFLSAMVKCRTKGNVLVAHWYRMCVNGVVTHSFTRG